MRAKKTNESTGYGQKPRDAFLLGAFGSLIASSLAAASCGPLHDDLESLSERFGESVDGQGENGGSSGAMDPGGMPASGETCGNGLREGGEQCDEGGVTSSCDADCTFSACGDGSINSKAGESCDSSGSTAECFECASALPECPASCECTYSSGSLYAVCGTTSSNFEDAEALCLSHDFVLASLESAKESDFVGHFLANEGFESAWVGGRKNSESVWSWPDSSVFFLGAFPGGNSPDGAFVDWAPLEPSPEANRDCLALDLGGGPWVARSCAEVLPAICERESYVPSSCGNGLVEEGEACDAEGASKGCDADCTRPACGDGHVNPAAGEDCDDGNGSNLDACRGDCSSTGLVAYWPFTELVGNRAFDLSLSSAHLDLFGPVELGKPGAYFGSGTRASVTQENLRFSGDFTVSFFVKTSSVSSKHFIITDNTNDGDPEFDVFIDDGEVVAVVREGDGTSHPPNGSLVISGVPLDGSEFKHFAFTCAGGKWSAYLEGSLSSTYEDTICRIPGGSSFFNVGAGSSGNELAGTLMGLRVYERALSGTELLELAMTTP